MRHLRGRSLFSALLSGVALFTASAAQAQINVVFNGNAPSGSGTEFSYNVFVTTGSKVVAGDFFTIYDANGYQAGSAFSPADWDIDVQNIGITPSSQGGAVSDDAGVVNITFTYTGATILGPAGPVGGASAFGFVSDHSATKSGGQYAYDTTKHNPGFPDNNTVQQGVGILVTPAAVPEASSLMLLVPGLVPLGIMLRRRARKE